MNALEMLKMEVGFLKACREAGIRAAREGRVPEPPAYNVPGTTPYEAWELEMEAYEAERRRLAASTQ